MLIMNLRNYLLSVLILLAGLSVNAQFEWSGSRLPVLKEDVASSTGLTAVYVAPGVEGLSVTYTGDGAASAQWSRFSSLGGGYAEPLSTGPSLTAIESDMGYIVEAAGRQYAFWLVDYSRHQFEVENLTESTDQFCGRVSLDVTGKGDEIAYYTVNGRRLTLSREISLDYKTLVFDNTSGTYSEKPTSEVYEYLRPVLSAPAPLCATDFTLSGDKFLRAWREEEVFTSAVFSPHSVEAVTTAEQETREADNEVMTSTGSLGGSAPCVIDFSASVTDAAIFHEWQFSRTPDFDDILLHISDLNFTHTFQEEGITYVRFYCANADASCDFYGETYEISIGASSLRCPNAFSPFNGDGVNDEWKVSYSSIISFECTIFNRSGHKIISFSDPAQGWDGKYNGKFVPAGVYYYVIRARGADGRKYELSGDINIVDYK